MAAAVESAGGLAPDGSRTGAGQDMARRTGIKAIGITVFAMAMLAAMASPAAAAENELPPLVHDIGIGVFLSGVLAILFARIKIPPIAGYILAGIVAGPLGLKLVTDSASIDTIAELGFVLLLFVIGLEMDVGKIIKSGRTILLTGAFQYPLIIVFGFLVATVLSFVGFAGLLGPLGPLYVGFVIGGSSTLLVVK
ncbi:MAG TPA: cation:proton antiporter, partial [Bauldia sp.]|nr:cation:proton antiporter [Bauldia sp.]